MFSFIIGLLTGAMFGFLLACIITINTIKSSTEYREQRERQG